MALCGALITLALNATLLGHQGLKVAAVRAPLGQQTCTSEIAPIKSNAVITFKNVRGEKVYDQKIYVSDLEFFLTEKDRKVVPMKEAVILLSVPGSSESASIKSVQLKFTDGSFDQSVNVKLPNLSPAIGAKT